PGDFSRDGAAAEAARQAADREGKGRAQRAAEFILRKFVAILDLLALSKSREVTPWQCQPRLARAERVHRLLTGWRYGAEDLDFERLRKPLAVGGEGRRRKAEHERAADLSYREVGDALRPFNARGARRPLGGAGSDRQGADGSGA